MIRFIIRKNLKVKIISHNKLKIFIQYLKKEYMLSNNYLCSLFK